MEDQKNTSFFRFEDLRVYHKSLEYYKWLADQIKQADEFSSKTLLMPLLDTAAKVSVNIAEGSSKHRSEFVEYLNYAKTFVRQCVVFTTMAEQNKMFTAEQTEISRNMLIEMTKMLGAMIVSLQRDRRRNTVMSDSNNVSVSNNSMESDLSVDSSDFSFNY